jgi:hypothetical protein
LPEGPLSIVLPLPRYDIAEADDPLIEELLKRGHRVHVVTTPDLEQRYRFIDRGCRVSLVDWTESSHFVGRAAAAFTDMLRMYRNASRVVEAGSCVITPSNDADFFKPFVEAARARRATVAFVQMAYFHADLITHYQTTLVESWSRLSWIRRAFLHARGRMVSALTGLPIHVGPRRGWGTNADICFMADESQARNHVVAGFPADRFRPTGVPFMDMIWRRRASFDRAARDAARRELGGDPARPTLLVVTQSPEWLLPGQAVDRRAFARDLMRVTTNALPGWDIVFKIHPVERLDDYRDARDAARCPIHLVREFNIVTALLACDLMMSVDISSPCYYARELGVPQVIFRVKGATVNDAHVPNFSGVAMADDHEQLTVALQTLAAKKDSGSGTGSGTFDGMASRRIVDELERWMGTRGVMPSDARAVS